MGGTDTCILGGGTESLPSDGRIVSGGVFWDISGLGTLLSSLSADG